MALESQAPMTFMFGATQFVLFPGCGTTEMFPGFGTELFLPDVVVFPEVVVFTGLFG